MNKLGIIVYKATKTELFLSKYLPYLIPFISKRKRIKIKWYFKYRYRQRVANAFIKALKPIQNYEKINLTYRKIENWEIESRWTLVSEE